MKKGIILLISYSVFGCGGSSDSSSEPVPPVMHLITTTSSTGGIIEPASKNVEAGASASFTIVLNEGYLVEEINGCNGILVENTYAVSQVSSDCTIDVTFSLNEAILAPTAEILFPWSRSNKKASRITVRGTANSSNGLASVSVNGVEAAIDDTAKKAQFSVTKQSLLMTNNTPGETYNWSATVNISNSATTKLVVKTMSNDGSVNTAAATAYIEQKIIPNAFTIDHTNNRLLGRTFDNKLLTLGLNSNDVAIVTPIFSQTGESRSGGLNNLSYSKQHDALIYAKILTGALSLHAVDVTTGELTTLVNYDLDLDDSEWLFASVNDISYDNVEDSVYLSLVYFSAKNYDFNSTAIFKYNVVTGTMNVIADSGIAYGSRAVNSRIKYTNAGLLVTDSGSDSSLIDNIYNGISLLSLSGAQLSPIASLPDFQVYSLDLNQANTLAYSVGALGIAKVDLNLGQYQIISPDEQESELNFVSLENVALDEANNRLLVGDAGLDMIVQVNLTTGVRSEFLSNGIGTGRRMIAPREIAIANQENYIYVADTGGNKAGAIIAIDLATGNRTIILDLARAESQLLADIIVDDNEQQLYVLFEQALIKIDLATKVRTTISNNYIGGGEVISRLSGATLDSENNSMLVTDTNNSTLLSIDLTTGKRTLIAAEFGYVGNGNSSAVDVEFDQLNKKAFVLSQSLGTVFSVDIDSGNKEIVLVSCLTSNNEEGLKADDWMLTNMFFDKEKRQLLITAEDTLLLFDVDNNTCTAPRKNWSTYGLLDIVVTAKGQVFASDLNLLKQIDILSGEHVLISK